MPTDEVNLLVICPALEKASFSAIMCMGMWVVESIVFAISSFASCMYVMGDTPIAFLKILVKYEVLTWNSLLTSSTVILVYKRLSINFFASSASMLLEGAFDRCASSIIR